MSETAQELNKRPYIRAHLVLLWQCPECGHGNTLGLTAWHIYKNIAECVKCECAVTVGEP